MPSKKYAKAADSVFKNRLIRKQRGRCYYCEKPFGKKGTADAATFEHLIPKSKGGKFNDKNIVLACKECNNNRGSEYTPAQWATRCHEVNASIRKANAAQQVSKRKTAMMKNDRFLDLIRHGVEPPRERVKMKLIEVVK